jgi:hypothetical protein
VLEPRRGQPQVLHPGDSAVFLCTPQHLDLGRGIHNTIQWWWINESRVIDHNPEHVTTSIDPYTEIGSLLIHNVLLVHNGSTIQCSMNESSGISYSNQLLLLVES